MYLAKILETSKGTFLFDAINSKIVKINDKNILFNPHNFQKFIGENKFRDVKTKKEFNIKYYYTDSELKWILSNKVKSLTLVLTEQCNLRCEYCGYMSKYLDVDYITNDMSKEVAFKGIDILMNNSEKSDMCYLSFYGGEPLLRLDLIKDCLLYIKEQYPFRAPIFNITTNAVLLDSATTDFLIENDFYINISLDGPTQQQNKYRVDKNKNPSFYNVFNNIFNFYKKNPSFFKTHITFNAVITHGVTDELYTSLNKLWKADINLIDLVPTPYFLGLTKEKENLKNELIDIKKYNFAYKSFLKVFKKYHKELTNQIESSTILPGGFCIPGIRKNFVTTGGKIVLCEKVDEAENIFCIGDVYNGIDITKVKNLLEKTLNQTKKCKDCWAAKFCSLCFKDILAINDDFCEKSQQRVEKELIYYIEEIQPNKKLTNYLDNLSIN